MIAYASLLIYTMVISGFTQELINIPVRFGLYELESASTDPSEVKYYYTSICAKGVAKKTEASLQLFVSDNPYWNTTSKGFVVVQVSICQNEFDAKCVIATNYKWGIHVKAVPNITWTMKNETIYYIRAMALVVNTEFSMELTFTNTKNENSYPWTTNNPFGGTTVPSNIKLEALFQYWISENLYTVPNQQKTDFSIAYCNQGETIKGIDVAIATTPNATDYSLIQQWACPQTYDIADCTYSNNDWYNPHVASFNNLQCDNQKASTGDGIYVVVRGDGANTDGKNTFIFSASQYI